MAFEEEYGPLPPGVSAESVTYSLWDNVEYIREIQKDALQARFIVTSHAMVLIDSFSNHAFFGDKENRYLIIDEADMFADMAELQQQRRLNLNELQHSLDKYLSLARKKSLSSVVDGIRCAAGNSHC